MDEELIRRLNQGQASVVQAEAEGTLVVLAPPGAGKTHTLLRRAQRLAKEGGRVLFLSPYRAAAQQIQDRLDEQGPSDCPAGSFTVYTPLQLALEVVRVQQSAQLLPRSQWEQVVDELLREEFGDRLPADRSSLQHLLRASHPAFPPAWPKELVDRVEGVRARLCYQTARTGLFTEESLLELLHEQAVQKRAPVWDHVLVDSFNELPAPLLDSLPRLARVGLTLTGDLNQLPHLDSGQAAEHPQAGTLSLDRLPHIPPLRVIHLTFGRPSPAPELQVARASRPLLDLVLEFLGEQVARRTPLAYALVIVQDVRTRQALAPGIDAWLDALNLRHPVPSADEQSSREPTETVEQVSLVTWFGAKGLEADIALLVLTQPPSAEFAAQMLQIGVTRARQLIRILVAEDVAPAWVEELRRQSITYREVGNETT